MPRSGVDSRFRGWIPDAGLDGRGASQGAFRACGRSGAGARPGRGPTGHRPPAVLLRAESLEAFDRVLARIRLVEGISSTETSLLLSTHKL